MDESSLSGFWHMGGYAQYVWPSYVVALGTIVLSSWAALRQLRAARDEARRALHDEAEGA